MRSATRSALQDRTVRRTRRTPALQYRRPACSTPRGLCRFALAYCSYASIQNRIGCLPLQHRGPAQQHRVYGLRHCLLEVRPCLRSGSIALPPCRIAWLPAASPGYPPASPVRPIASRGCRAASPACGAGSPACRRASPGLRAGSHVGLQQDVGAVSHRRNRMQPSPGRRGVSIGRTLRIRITSSCASASAALIHRASVIRARHSAFSRRSVHRTRAMSGTLDA